MRAACIAGLVAFVLYLGINSDFGFDVTVDEGFALIFNDMLLRLLRGDFSSDPSIVGFEAFFVDGKTYTYFGIAPALVRLPLMPFFDLQTQSVARLTCSLAAAGAVFFNVASVMKLAAGKLPRTALALLLICCLFTGLPFILTQKSSVYLEASLWMTFLASAYAYILARSFSGGLNWRSLFVLAIVSGVALHTRATTGFGLCLATSFVLAYFIVTQVLASARISQGLIAATRIVGPAVAVLAICSAGMLYVNYMRWGNPFEVADLSRQTLVLQYFPDRAARFAEQGVTNIDRLWFGVQYYFFPIWMAWDETGRTIFASWVARHMDGAELPPSSFLLTHAVWVGLAWCGLSTLAARRKEWSAKEWAVALAAFGALAPGAFVLMHIYMALRYQVEFYPALLVLAFYGLHVVADASWFARRRVLLGLGTFAAVSASFVTLAWTQLPLGPSNDANLPFELRRALTERVGNGTP